MEIMLWPKSVKWRVVGLFHQAVEMVIVQLVESLEVLIKKKKKIVKKGCLNLKFFISFCMYMILPPVLILLTEASHSSKTSRI